MVLFGLEKFDTICNRIRYPVILKSCITYDFSHYYAKIKVDSYDSVPLEKRLFLHNVIMLIKPVFNKNGNQYYYNISLKNNDKYFFDSKMMLSLVRQS